MQKTPHHLCNLLLDSKSSFSWFHWCCLQYYSIFSPWKVPLQLHINESILISDFFFSVFHLSSLVPVEFCAYLAKLGYPSRQFGVKTQYMPSMLWKNSPVHFKGWKQLHPALHLRLKPSLLKDLHTFQPHVSYVKKWNKSHISKDYIFLKK